MKRIIFAVVTVGLLALVLAGCGGPPTAEDVLIGDIGSYDINADFYGDSTSAESDFGQAVSMMLISMGDLNYTERNLSVDTLRKALLQAPVEKTINSKSASLESSGDANSSTMRLTIIDEELTPSNSSAVSGTLSIPDLLLQLRAGATGDEYSGQMWAEVFADGSLEAEDFRYTDVDLDYDGIDDIIYTVTVDHGVIRIGSSGNANISWDASGNYNISYSLYLDFKVGLAIHNDSGRGGRLLLNLNYSESFADTITYDEYTGLVGGDYTAAPNVDISARLEVYANDASTYTWSENYTQDDIGILVSDLLGS